MRTILKLFRSSSSTGSYYLYLERDFVGLHECTSTTVNAIANARGNYEVTFDFMPCISSGFKSGATKVTEVVPLDILPWGDDKRKAEHISIEVILQDHRQASIAGGATIHQSELEVASQSKGILAD